MSAEQTAASMNVLPFEVGSGSRLSKAQRNEARQFALMLVRDETYRSRLLKDWRSRNIPPAIEQMIYHYAFGKPKETIEFGKVDDAELEHMPAADLAKLAAGLSEVLRQIGETQSEQDAQAQTDAELAYARRKESA